MEEFETRVGQKGQITLPSKLRRRLGIKHKDIVRMVAENDGVRIEKRESKLIKGFGAVTPHRRPEDWNAIRGAVEEEIAEEVMREE